MLKEFKEFAMRGSMLDMAIGIILGAAFGKIIASLVSDVLMPPLGLLLGKADFSDYFVNLTSQHYATLADAHKAGAAVIAYGSFVNTIINFLIVAFAIFLLIRQINRLKRKKEEAPPPATTKECPYCVSAIPIKATRCPQCTSSLQAA